jgi:hypothetical protein
MQRQKQGVEAMSMQEAFNLLNFLLHALATIVTPLTRFGFGAQALGFQGIGAFVALCFWIIGCQSLQLELYLFIWVAVMLVQRGKTLIDGMRGRYLHSHYTGYPWLTGWLCRDEALAKLMEGTLVLVAGVFLEGLWWPVGHMLMVSGGCIIFLEGIHNQYRKREEEAIRDGVIEMEARGQRLRQQWQVRR